MEDRQIQTTDTLINHYFRLRPGWCDPHTSGQEQLDGAESVCSHIWLNPANQLSAAHQSASSTPKQTRLTHRFYLGVTVRQLGYERRRADSKPWYPEIKRPQELDLNLIL